MKKLLTTIVCLILLMGTSMMNARPPMYTSTNTEVPSKLVKNEHGSWQLIVNGKPFIMLAGELHNSSASTTEYLNSLWTPLKTLNLNTVLAPIAWEQFEPQEGIFDYTLINNMIDGARKNGFKLSILWFGSWKNGESSYAPTWVKEDTKRFFRVKNVEGKEIETLSPFCENAMKADAKAFKTWWNTSKRWIRQREQSSPCNRKTKWVSFRIWTTRKPHLRHTSRRFRRHLFSI